MPVVLYETMVLFDASKITVDNDGIRNGVAQMIEKMGGKIEIHRPWDDRRIAYPIQKQKKGAYHIYYYRMESTKVPELEREYKLNENILRVLTSHIEGKWSDAMLEVAKNETGNGFALRGMHDDSPLADTSLAGIGDVPSIDAFDNIPSTPRKGRRNDNDEKPE